MTLDTNSVAVHPANGGIEVRTEKTSAGLSAAETEQLIVFLERVIAGKAAGIAFSIANDSRKLEVAEHAESIELLFIRDNMLGTVIINLDKAKVPRLLEQVNEAIKPR